MRRLLWLPLLLTVLVVGSALAQHAFAQQPAPGSATSATAVLPSAGASSVPTVSASAGASASPSSSASTAPPTSGMPAGHPPVAGPPPGHPPTGGGQQGRFFRAPEDIVSVDKSLGVGVLDVRIVDADNQPIPNAEITLAVLRNTVTKGESKEYIKKTTNDRGGFRFDSLDVGTGISYRVSVKRDEAEYTTIPFGMKDRFGVRVILHAYEAVTDMLQAQMAVDAWMMLDIKEDAIVVQHRMDFTNLGRTAYVAKDVRIPPPEGYTAFDKQDSDADAGVREKEGVMVLYGTFPPGTTQALYRYQVPLRGKDKQSLQLPLPPGVFRAQILLGASQDMGLEVKGFPEAQRGKFMGKRVLGTAMMSENRTAALEGVDVTVSGIPVPGPSRLIAVLLGLVAIAVGGAYFFGRQDASSPRLEQIEDLREAKGILLAEFAVLERARLAGNVGPHSYTRLRETLLDALARIVKRLDNALALQAKYAPQTATNKTGRRDKKKRRAKRDGVAPGKKRKRARPTT